MNEVIIIVFEAIYPNLLVEALVNNPSIKITKIIKSGNLVGNKSFFKSLIYFFKKGSLFFLLSKGIELLLYYFSVIFIPQKKRTFKSLKEISLFYNIPVEISYDINNHFKSQESLKYQILFSISYWQRVHRKTLDLFRDSFNIHPAPLPEGKGLFPSFWLLLYPTKNNRCYQTVHRMAEKIDEGAIIAQGSEELHKHERSSTRYMLIATEIGCKILKQLKFHQILKPNFVAEHYISGVNTYYSFPSTKDVFSFWRKGNAFIRLLDIRDLIFKKHAES